MGFGRATKAMDLCSVCTAYDTVLLPEMAPAVRHVIASLEAIMPTYFGSVSLGTGDDPDETLRAVHSLLLDLPSANDEFASALTPEARVRLAMIEAVCSQSLEALVATSHQFVVHFQLRDRLHSSLLYDFDHPEAATLFVLSDWKDCWWIDRKQCS